MTAGDGIPEGRRQGTPPQGRCETRSHSLRPAREGSARCRLGVGQDRSAHEARIAPWSPATADKTGGPEPSATSSIGTWTKLSETRLVRSLVADPVSGPDPRNEDMPLADLDARRLGRVVDRRLSVGTAFARAGLPTGRGVRAMVRLVDLGLIRVVQDTRVGHDLWLEPADRSGAP